MGTYTLSSQRKNTGSGTKKLAAFRERYAVSSSKKTETPAQYRAKVETAKQSTAQTRVTPQTAFKQTDRMLKAVAQPTQLTATQQNELTRIITSSNTTPGATQEELRKIRTVMGPGYQAPRTMPVYQVPAQKQALINAVKNDLQLRARRINQRDTQLNTLSNKLTLRENKLKQYDKLIKNGQFTGTQKQYQQYLADYQQYKEAVYEYNSTLQLQKEDVKTYNKNNQSLEKKQPALKLYRQTERKIQSKLPAPEDVTKFLQKTMINQWRTQNKAVTSKIPKNSQAYRDWEKSMGKVMTEADANNRAKFYGGMYKAVYDQPLKAVATAATFFVGGVALKGLSSGVKAFASAAKLGTKGRSVVTATGKAIEGGLLGIYVGQTGKRYVLAEDAAQYGYVTGDVLFNEILPAGLGMRYGIKVVEKLPTNVKRIRGTGTKIKRGLKEFAKAEAAEVSPSVRAKRKAAQQKAIAKTKTAQKSDAQLIAEFEKSQSQWAKQEAQLQREYNSIMKETTALEAKMKSSQRTYARSKARMRQVTTSRTLSQQADQRFRSLQVQRERLRTKQLKLKKQLDELQAKLQEQNKESVTLQKTLQKQLTEQQAQLKLAQKEGTVTLQKSIQRIINKTKQMLKKVTVNIKTNKLIIASVQKQKQKQDGIYKKTLVIKAAVSQTQKELSVIDRQEVAKLKKAVKPATTKARAKPPAKRPVKKAKKSEKTKIPTVKVPKVPKLTTAEKKKKAAAARRRKLAKQKNINAVATFKDLLG